MAVELWIDELVGAIDGLCSFPRRFPLAPEDRVLSLGLRHRILGNYRILYLVREDPPMVDLLHIRHARRAAADQEDLR
jgi:plasmid stabilization system protein ParE